MFSLSISYDSPYTTLHVDSPLATQSLLLSKAAEGSTYGAAAPDTDLQIRAALSVRGKPAKRYDWIITSSTRAESTLPAAFSITRRVTLSSAPAIAPAICTSALVSTDIIPLRANPDFADNVAARIPDRMPQVID